MEARNYFPVLGLATVLVIAQVGQTMAQVVRVQQPSVEHSQNFIVFAATDQLAGQVSEAAEAYRRDLAVYWLGEALPAWRERCPIHVQANPNLGASGETTFALDRGTAGRWIMAVHGTRERILDSVLPHEITHTIFATHFAKYGKYVPRWADEGASTTVEHEAEKRKHRYFVHDFLKTGRGLSFNKMFSLKEYPNDILPLYAQGHSAVQFLLDQGGARKFVQFLEAGMQNEAWELELRKAYGYQTIGEFQTLWNKWLADGSPAELAAYAPGLRRGEASTIMLASQDSASSPFQLAVGNGEQPPMSLVQQSRLLDASRSLDANATSPQTEPASAVAQVQSAHLQGHENYYKRRLIEVSGSPATPVPVHNAMTTNANHPVPPSYARQQSARPMSAQSPGIRVMDWGDRAPVHGLQHAGNPQPGASLLR